MPDAAVIAPDAVGPDRASMHKVVSTDSLDEVRLYCYSEESGQQGVDGIVRAFQPPDFETAPDRSSTTQLARTLARTSGSTRSGNASDGFESQAFPRRLALPDQRHRQRGRLPKAVLPVT